MEEARNIKAEKAKVERELMITKDKVNIARKRVGELETVIVEYR